MLGYSQGSIIVRGALERCSLRVHNLITLSDIHQGIFSIPYLLKLPAQFRELVTKYAYETPVQDIISVANYWRNPDQLNRYIHLIAIISRISIMNMKYEMKHIVQICLN
jgi:hypothetical protein